MTQQRLPIPNPLETAAAWRAALETAIRDAAFYGKKGGEERIEYYRERLSRAEQREKERGIAA